MKKNIAAIVVCWLFANPAHAFAGTITAGPGDSSVLFRIHHDLGYTIGYFKDFTAALELSDDQAHVLAAKAQVQTASISTRNALRDEGLKSGMFLDASQFPQASFESTQVQGDQMSGVLTIRGISKPVTLTITRDTEAKKTLLKGNFNRNDYGITYNSLMANKKKTIGDTVELIVELKG